MAARLITALEVTAESSESSGDRFATRSARKNDPAGAPPVATLAKINNELIVSQQKPESNGVGRIASKCGKELSR